MSPRLSPDQKLPAQASRPQAIARNYLHDQVADHLRALIRSGEIKPRARLNETDLAKRFGISRTPLREAIKILFAEGLLDILPNRGAQVASISRAEIEEMIEVIAGLEATAGELLALHILDHEIDAIEAMHLQIVQAYERLDEQAYFTLNQRIHEAMVGAARNATLQGIYANLSNRVQRARFTAHKTSEQWAQAVADHTRMISLMRDRNGGLLGQLMRDHVRRQKDVIAATYADGPVQKP